MFNKSTSSLTSGWDFTHLKKFELFAALSLAVLNRREIKRVKSSCLNWRGARFQGGQGQA